MSSKKRIAVLTPYLIAALVYAGDQVPSGVSPYTDAFEDFFEEREPTPQEKAQAAAILDAESRAMAQLAESLKQIDRIQVFLLNPKINPYAERTFPISPYSTYTEITSMVEVSGELIPSFVSGLSALFAEVDFRRSAMCHYPVHGVRCFRGKSVVFETSIAWNCNNFYAYYGGSCHWMGIGDTKNTTTLIALFERVLPLKPEYKDPNWSPN